MVRWWWICLYLWPVIFGEIVESLSLFHSLQAQFVLTLERSLDLQKAVLLALLNLQSQDACYRSQQKHSTHRPSNQWGAAGLPGRDWLIKEKKNKQQGKGRAWQSVTPEKHREEPRGTVGGEGRENKKGQTQKRDERNIYSGLITHKSIDWCVESHWGLSWHGQVRRGSLNIHDAGRSLLVLGCWGRFTSSWRLLEKQAKISAPPFTLQHSASLHVCWGTSAVRVVLLMSRERRVSKATWLVEKSDSKREGKRERKRVLQRQTE